jgi:Ca-activated chloride channel homolog
MQGARQGAALDAVDAILATLTPADEALLHVFNDRQALWAGWTTDKVAAVTALRLAHPEGGTELYQAVVNAAQELHAARNRKRALILITDGRDSTVERERAVPSSLDRLGILRDVAGEAVKALQQSETLVYSVGIDWPYEGPNQFRMVAPSLEHPDAAALRRLTDATGGVTFIAAQVSGLLKAAREITEDLRHQYTVAYSPQRKPDGRHRRIRVTTSDSDHVVRSRQGYVAIPRPAK